MATCTTIQPKNRRPRNMTGGVYIYYFMNDPIKGYIGSTFNFKKRHTEHLWDLKNKCHPNNRFQNAYNKYGKENMTYRKIEEESFPQIFDKILVRKHLEERETHFLNLIKCKFNLQEPGKYQIRPRTKKETSNLDYRKRVVYQVDDDLQVVRSFSGLREAARELEISARAISCVANLKYSHVKRLKFRFQETLGVKYTGNIKYPKKEKVKTRDRERIVLCYNLNGEFQQEYTSIKKAALSLNLQESGIARCCIGEMKYTGSYTFRFKKGNNLAVLPVKIKRQEKIICYKNGEFFMEFKSLRAAEKVVPLSATSIHYYCNKNLSHYKEYSFYYESQSPKN